MEYYNRPGLLASGAMIIIASLLLIFHFHDFNDNGLFRIEYLISFVLALTLMCAGLGMVHYSLIQLSHKTFILMTLYTAVGLGSSHIFERLDMAKENSTKRLEAYQKINHKSSVIQSAIWSDINRSNAIVSMLQATDYQFSEQEFNHYAELMLNRASRLRLVALAKDLVVNHIYPLKGNEQVIGLDYRTNQQQLPMIRQAIDNRQITLAGPVNLVQGGVALICRIPLFYLGTGQRSENLWGIMSIIINMDGLFAPLNAKDLKHLTIAIRGRDGAGEKGGMVYGTEAVFDQNPVIDNINLPYGRWQIAAIPVDGWPTISPNASQIYTSVGIMWLIIFIFTLFRAHQHKQTERSIDTLHDELEDSSRRTDEIEEESRAQVQAQKLEAIGQLTGGIAHDFNNILAAITGYAQLSQMILQSDRDTDKLNKHIGEIIKAGDRAKSLVKQMLTFSRGRDIQAEVIEPMTVLQETLQMMHAILPASIQLNTDYQDFDSRIKIDPVQLQQLLINLVVNARDAIPNASGNITIGSRLIENFHGKCTSCNKEVSGNYLCLSVIDNGTGINPEKFTKIFDPFFTTKEVGKGTGMGLSVVHGIVHGVNGHINITSKLNQGTRIDLLFEVTNEPLTNTTSDFQLPEIQSRESSQNKMVLVLDDEQTITQLYEDIFEARSIRSIIFNEPRLALDYFQQHQQDIALIITDYTMPDLNGIEFIRAVRRRDEQVSIFLCSGNAEVIDKHNLTTLKIDRFLTKPVDLLALALAVADILKISDLTDQ